MMGLTRRQHDLLEFIKQYMRQHHIAPSYSEMVKGMGYAASSKGAIAEIMNSLEERGVIRRMRHKSRAFELVESSVNLNDEICRLTDQYAQAHDISRETAVNEALRQWLGAAA